MTQPFVAGIKISWRFGRTIPLKTELLDRVRARERGSGGEQ